MKTQLVQMIVTHLKMLLNHNGLAQGQHCVYHKMLIHWQAQHSLLKSAQYAS